MWKSISAALYVGSKLTLRNLAENVYLHSHDALIPQSHQDKVSSNGQQVTGYSISDDMNNEWIIELAPNNLLFNDDGTLDVSQLEKISCLFTGLYPSPGELEQLLHDGFTSEKDFNLQFKKPISNNDLIRLRHAATGKYLLSHDVASPLTLTNMEVTAFFNEDLSNRYNNTLFRIEFFKAVENPALQKNGIPSTTLVSNSVFFRLKHEVSGAHIRNHRQNLPSEWGFNQREINGSKQDESLSSIWVVEHIQWPAHTKDTLAWTSTSASVAPTDSGMPLNYIQKLIEHQLLTWNNLKPKWDNSGAAHPYSCHPLLWPFLVRGISMWDNFMLHRQVYLIGNPILWWLAAASLIALTLIFITFKFFQPQKQRKDGRLGESNCSINSTDRALTNVIMRHLVERAAFIYVAFAFHFIPYVLLSIFTNFLFISSYLPAFSLSVLILGIVIDAFLIDFINLKIASSRIIHIRLLFQLVLIGAAVYGFYRFSPLTFGHALSTSEGEALRWLPTWEFLVTLHPTAPVHHQ
jgi:dolichyl-phosphate-mannose-protein mannosyltransferase